MQLSGPQVIQDFHDKHISQNSNNRNYIEESKFGEQSFNFNEQ